MTQPRVTCFRVGIRMNEPRMPALLVEHHRPGFYFRVLQEGEVGAGDEIVKVAAGPAQITVAKTDGFCICRTFPGRAERALRIPALSTGWQDRSRRCWSRSRRRNPCGGESRAGQRRKAPAWPGFKAMRVAQIHKESDMSLPLPWRRWTENGAGSACRSIRRLAAAGPTGHNRRFFAVTRCRSAGTRSLPDQRESRSKRNWQRLSLQSRARKATCWRSARREELLSVRPAMAPLYCSARASAQRRCCRCCTRSPPKRSQREIWSIYGARNRASHSFAPGVACRPEGAVPKGAATWCTAGLSQQTSRGSARCFRHLDAALLEKIGEICARCRLYLCGPSAFLKDMRDGTSRVGCVPGERVHTWKFWRARGDHAWHGGRQTHPACSCRAARYRPLDCIYTQQLWFPGILSLPACLNWRRLATFPFDGRAAPGFATPV